MLDWQTFTEMFTPEELELIKQNNGYFLVKVVLPQWLTHPLCDKCGNLIIGTAYAGMIYLPWFDINFRSKEFRFQDLLCLPCAMKTDAVRYDGEGLETVWGQ